MPKNTQAPIAPAPPQAAPPAPVVDPAAPAPVIIQRAGPPDTKMAPPLPTLKDTAKSADAPPPEVSIEDLIRAVEQKQDDPILHPAEPHKGLDYNAVLDALPEDAKKLLGN